MVILSKYDANIIQVCLDEYVRMLKSKEKKNKEDSYWLKMVGETRTRFKEANKPMPKTKPNTK